MGVIRIEKSQNYTVMSNYHLRDKSLSLKAKGLMSLMLSLPDDWDYSIAGLVAIVAEGETAVRSTLTELIDHKYLTRERLYSNGKIVDWSYTLYEMPTDVGLPVENQQLDNQVQENQVQINKDNNQIKNNKSTLPGALAKHPRNFSKEKLTDDLESGKDIDAQKTKKKPSEFDKCVEELNSRYKDTSIHILLLQHLDWSYHSKDPKRIRSLSAYRKRLDELDKLEGDKVKIIQQSVDKQWHCFYELQTSSSKQVKHELGEVYSTPLEVSKAKLAEKKAKGVKVY